MGTLRKLIGRFVTSDLADNRYGEAALFRDFAADRFLRGLSFIDPSARKDPNWDIATLNQENRGLAFIKNNARNSFHRGPQYLYYMLLFLFLVSCSRYVEVKRLKVNSRTLASSWVNSPDPAKENPPLGEMLFIDWQVPGQLLYRNPELKLYVIYWDNQEKVYTWPINRRKGYETFSLLDEDFIRTGGFLTYRAEIVTEDGCIYRDWKHQLWVNLIKMDNEETQSCPCP